MTDDTVSIAINGTSHPILCGICKEPVAFIGEADAEPRQVGCAGCGNIDDVEQVARMTAEYAKDEGQMILNRMARDAARKSKFMTFEGKTAHDKAHRFIVDLKL